MNMMVYKTFLLVAQLLNITKAAQQLSFSQPAITAQMHSLEATFGVRLFDRSGRKLTLTPAGQEFVNYAERMLALYEEAQKAMAVFRDDVDQIKLGVSTQLINYLLPPLLREFQGQMPSVFVSVEVCMNTQGVLKGLVEHRYDLGFIHGYNTLPQLRQHRVWAEDIFWVASPELIRERPEIPTQTVVEWPLVNFTVGSVFRTKLDQWLNGRQVNAVLEYSDSEAVKRAVIGGLGVSYLPRMLVEEAVAGGKLVVLQPALPFQLDISLVHLTNKSFTVPLYALLLAIVNIPGVDATLREVVSS